MARFLMNVMLASGRLSVDGHPPEGPQGLSRGAGSREHRCGHQTVHDAPRTARAMGA
jgi:hypothetical protein